MCLKAFKKNDTKVNIIAHNKLFKLSIKLTKENDKLEKNISDLNDYAYKLEKNISGHSNCHTLIFDL